MRTHWAGLLGLLLLASAARAQVSDSAEVLHIKADRAFTWTEQSTNVVQLEGGIAIDLDQTHMAARRAVVWITPVPRSIAHLQRLEVVLMDDVVITDPSSTQSGRWYYVEASIRGTPRLTARSRMGVNQSVSELYKEASAHRPVLLVPGEPPSRRVLGEAAPGAAATQPAKTFRPTTTVEIQAGTFQTEKTPEGRIAAVFPGKIAILSRNQRGDYIELLADRAVVFTPYVSLTETTPGERLQKIEQAVVGAYVEGDVRIYRTPGDQTQPEQRVTASRAYYDFTTDRAVMTDVIMHTSDPKSNVPMIVRARMVRQLSEHEYTAEHGLITTSSFAKPSLSIGARTTYIRQTNIDDPITGTQTQFVARNATFDVYGVPVFWSPYLAGEISERGTFRRIEVTNQREFGFGVITEWGLFESLHRLPPKGTDASYQLDYFSKRGPAGGLNAKYVGGVGNEATLEPWSYSGDFRSYLVYDTGEDDLGRRRVNVQPESEVRGRLYWRHQQILPNDWQVQITGGYISDPTFLEQWFNREFRTSQPVQSSIYAKHQSGSEAYSLLIAGQPNDFATVSDAYQEQAEVQRLPELSYRRVGDSLFGDRATFFSANTISALSFRDSEYSLADLGFRPVPGGPGNFSPGLPSYGTTGTPDDTTYRGDFRQELDFPFTFYRFRMVPYVVGRHTEYSESVAGSTAERAYVAAGLRVTTAFWKVDDTVQSDLFDLHRLRHVIEPELNLYTSAQSKDRDKLLNYDEPIDAITDISAVQVALNQRWQTKRGGPGQWRSVDVFTWNVQGNFFFNQPPDSELNPKDFRGLYFWSMPETSIPRNSVNTQIEWQLSDTVRILSDVYYNLDEATLSAASIGASIRHDTRVSYYLGLRHVGIDVLQPVTQNGQTNLFQFDSEDLVIGVLDYQLTSKYRMMIAEWYDAAQTRNNTTMLSLIRHFDRFYMSISFRVDELQSGSAVYFNIWPEGMMPGTTYGTLGGRGPGSLIP